MTRKHNCGIRTSTSSSSVVYDNTVQIFTQEGVRWLDFGSRGPCLAPHYQHSPRRPTARRRSWECISHRSSDSRRSTPCDERIYLRQPGQQYCCELDHSRDDPWPPITIRICYSAPPAASGPQVRLKVNSLSIEDPSESSAVGLLGRRREIVADATNLHPTFCLSVSCTLPLLRRPAAIHDWINFTWSTSRALHDHDLAALSPAPRSI